MHDHGSICRELEQAAIDCTMSDDLYRRACGLAYRHDENGRFGLAQQIRDRLNAAPRPASLAALRRSQ